LPWFSTEVTATPRVSREALHNTKSARMAELVSIAGRPSLIVAPRGRLAIALSFAVSAGRITTMDVITDTAALRKLQIPTVRASAACHALIAADCSATQ